MQTSTDVPVLLIIFNRPAKTRRMVEMLREVKPSRVFVAADGPRADRPEDARRCDESRSLLADIDWPCEIHELFQDTNLGCKRGPETAITWFLTHVESGIILEDDCLPDPGFFPFCAELLERYADSDEVMMIGGHNQLGSWSGTTDSYMFSRTTPTWGWATWRRAWDHYDPAMTAWPTPEARHQVRGRMPAAEFRLTRLRFDRVHAGRLDAWDFAWAFAMLRHGGVSVIPSHNAITNIGFDDEATHTLNPWSGETGLAAAPVRFPLVHPDSTEPLERFETALFRSRFPLGRRVMTALPPVCSNALRTLLYGTVRIARRVRKGQH